MNPNKEEPTVYVGMCADILHTGHVNILKEAAKHGTVVVGLLTDKAMASYKRVPYMKYDDREEVLQQLCVVGQIIPQDTLDYTPNLRKIKPDYVVHGDDWQTGVQAETRQKVIDTLEQWGGELIEVAYTKDVSSTQLINRITSRGITPQSRRTALRRAIELKPIVRILEAHNGLTGLIAETTHITEDNKRVEFDGMWESSLTDSTSKGKPDNAVVDPTSRFQTIEQILEVTTKPMIVDLDNGGSREHFAFSVKTLERLGVSAVIIEDKIGPKRNSLFNDKVKQTQADPKEFAEKISTGVQTRLTDDFMVIARIESLILRQGVDDAIKRAIEYIEAGAQGIMIHSKDKDPSELFEFCNRYKKLGPTQRRPLVAVPSTYSQTTEYELVKHGIDVVIYANQLLRSAYPSMINTAKSILENGRAHEAEANMTPIKDIINLIPVTDAE